MSRAIAVANYYIRRGNTENLTDLSPNKLHALMYFAHGWRLGQSGHPQFEGHCLAFRDGVFVKKLRDEGCWGTRRVTELISVLAPPEQLGGPMRNITPELIKDDAGFAALDWVWDSYAGLTPYELSNLVREVDAPWDKTWNAEARTSDDPIEISVSLMRVWFLAELKHRKGQGKRGLADTMQRYIEPKQRPSAPDTLLRPA